MARLYSYVVRDDNGSAPNPFFGNCTLAIGKPRIRREAEVGDWIAGVASKRHGPGRLVYAMRVTNVVSMKDYDLRFPARRPDVRSKDWRRWLGDSIYDFSSNPPSVRKSVHGEEHRDNDLGGENVLVSDDFVYFGEAPIELPPKLLPIARVQQGHRSKLNEPLVAPFERWIRSLKIPRNVPLALPVDDPWKGRGPDRTL